MVDLPSLSLRDLSSVTKWERRVSMNCFVPMSLQHLINTFLHRVLHSTSVMSTTKHGLFTISSWPQSPARAIFYIYDMAHVATLKISKKQLILWALSSWPLRNKFCPFSTDEKAVRKFQRRSHIRLLPHSIVYMIFAPVLWQLREIFIISELRDAKHFRLSGRSIKDSNPLGLLETAD